MSDPAAMESSSGPSRPETSQQTDSNDATLQLLDGTAHLARFEFSDAGTKILMVEWLPEQYGIDGTGTGTAEADFLKHGAGADVAWEVSWPGKSTFLPARDSSPSSGPETRRRVFFLLPPAAPVPVTVTITPPGKTPVEVKPLPAIFPEGFGGDDGNGGSGTRGVLHTIWAKRRLRELEREMEEEMRANAESVGLEMVLAEKAWIEDNFLKSPVVTPAPSAAASIGMAPITSRSPMGGRLGERLKGLRLGTSPSDLVPQANTFTTGSQSQTLSPHGSDVAVSSFAAISLNAAVIGISNSPRTGDSKPSEAEDDLFALPMSPRSPEMKRSPFSAL